MSSKPPLLVAFLVVPDKSLIVFDCVFFSLKFFFFCQEWEKKSSEFATFKKAQEMRIECKGLNLGALLITPVQRVPRYNYRY